MKKTRIRCQIQDYFVFMKIQIEFYGLVLLKDLTDTILQPTHSGILSAFQVTVTVLVTTMSAQLLKVTMEACGLEPIMED
jgi:hypothetical protein